MLVMVVRFARAATGLRSKGFEGEVQDSIVRFQFVRWNAGASPSTGGRVVDFPVERRSLIGVVEAEVRSTDSAFEEEQDLTSRIEAGIQSVFTYNPLIFRPESLKASIVVCPPASSSERIVCVDDCS